ncbi:hypothetical protein K438DRAFT_1762473 [Mycena galopus ATCC 62051]|nr:hypothetical protein K438DRAFT_1762473 [Mycena galopus ATCC 62051]
MSKKRVTGFHPNRPPDAAFVQNSSHRRGQRSVISGGNRGIQGSESDIEVARTRKNHIAKAPSEGWVQRAWGASVEEEEEQLMEDDWQVTSVNNAPFWVHVRAPSLRRAPSIWRESGPSERRRWAAKSGEGVARGTLKNPVYEYKFGAEPYIGVGLEPAIILLCNEEACIHTYILFVFRINLFPIVSRLNRRLGMWNVRYQCLNGGMERSVNDSTPNRSKRRGPLSVTDRSQDIAAGASLARLEESFSSFRGSLGSEARGVLSLAVLTKNLII